MVIRKTKNTLHLSGPKAAITRAIDLLNGENGPLTFENVTGPSPYANSVAVNPSYKIYHQNACKKMWGCALEPELTLVEASHTEVYYEFDSDGPIDKLAIALSKRYKSLIVTYAMDQREQPNIYVPVNSRVRVLAWQAGKVIHNESHATLKALEVKIKDNAKAIDGS